MRTPGPWWVEERQTHAPIFADYNGKPQRIADCPQWTLGTYGPGPEEATANAAFIVEACNNYESLQARCDRYKAALDAIASCNKVTDGDVVDVARKALEE